MTTNQRRIARIENSHRVRQRRARAILPELLYQADCAFFAHVATHPDLYRAALDPEAAAALIAVYTFLAQHPEGTPPPPSIAAANARIQDVNPEPFFDIYYAHAEQALAIVQAEGRTLASAPPERRAQAQNEAEQLIAELQKDFSITFGGMVSAFGQTIARAAFEAAGLFEAIPHEKR